MDVSPESDTVYIINCNGDGGSTSSKADIAVVVPPPPAPPVVETVQPAPVVNLCKPAVLGLNFDTNKADIKPKYHDELKMVGNFLKEFPKAKGTIEGHTDNVGVKANNMGSSSSARIMFATTSSINSVLGRSELKPRVTVQQTGRQQQNRGRQGKKSSYRS